MNSGDHKLKEEMLIAVVKDVSEVRANISEIKADLREHMRRTSVLEVQSEFVKKNVYAAYGVISFLGLLGVLIKLYEMVAR